jgi:tRNA(Arg) A34 adenosine deaminase TadA
MAAMALVHSRIRRVFFCERNHHQEGAFISSSYHIHCLPSLNHHYRVFQIQSSNTSSIVAGASTVTHSENTILSSTLGPTTSTASTSLAESFSSTDETS